MTAVMTASHCTTAPAPTHCRLVHSALMPRRRLRHPVMSFWSSSNLTTVMTSAVFLSAGVLAVKTAKVGLSQIYSLPGSSRLITITAHEALFYDLFLLLLLM